MAGWPGGSYIVLESNIRDVDLLAIGYKYNKSDILYFVATKEAGHTQPGFPYIAKWKDQI